MVCKAFDFFVAIVICIHMDFIHSENVVIPDNVMSCWQTYHMYLGFGSARIHFTYDFSTHSSVVMKIMLIL